MSVGRTTRMLIVFAMASSAVAAQEDGRDEVVLRSASGGRVIQRGTILDFTGRELTFSPTGGDAVTYPRAEVVSVKTGRLGHHTKGERAYEAGEYATAARELELAVDAEGREWVRRDILALLTRCSLALGESRRARTRFGLLLESDRHNRHLHLVPLVWAPTPIDATTAVEGRTLLVHDLEMMRLIGASLLLEHAPNADEAERMMRRLSQSSDDVVRRLAVAQQWRLRLGRPLTDRELQRWSVDIARLPPRMRGGPRYLLGRGYVQLGLHDRAAIAFLWAPLVADHDHALSARAMVAAGDSLRLIGQDDRAFGLYREVVARYGHTTIAEDARAAIDELTRPESDP